MTLGTKKVLSFLLALAAVQAMHPGALASEETDASVEFFAEITPYTEEVIVMEESAAGRGSDDMEEFPCEEPAAEEDPSYEAEPVLDGEPAADKEPVGDDEPSAATEPVTEEDPAIENRSFTGEEPAAEEVRASEPQSVFTDGVNPAGNGGEDFLPVIASGACGDALTWTVSDTGLLAIRGTGDMDDMDEVCPWAEYKDSILAVEIADGVTSIGTYAFSDCVRLPEITIPDSVKSIGFCAFMNCDSLESITIPAGVNSMGSSVFYGCDRLTSAVIQGGTIGALAFQICGNLTDITILEGVTGIGSYAFAGCASLTSVSIPASVTGMGGYEFFGCSQLTDISVDSENPAFSSRDGVLLSRDGTVLICCPGGKSGAYTIPAGVTTIQSLAFGCCPALTDVTIPDTVTVIEPRAFYGCVGLTGIMIPVGVTRIGSGAFQSCSNLTSATIPASVTSIREDAFSGTALQDVYYAGTEADWNRIGGNSAGVPAAAVIHYKDPDAKAENRISATDQYASYSAKAQKVKLAAKAAGGKLSYKSSDSSVKVTSKGVVKLPAKFSGTVKITITAKGGDYKTAKKTVTVTVPQAPTLSSVKNSAANKIKVKWKKVAGVTGYQIQYATNKSFKSVRTVTVKGAGKVSRTIADLTKNKTYYVRVRAYRTVSGTTYYSAWSAKKPVKIT